MAVRVLTLFPPRPLHGKPPGLLGAVALAVLIVGMFGTMLVYAVGFVGPGLVTDALVRDRALTLSDGSVAGADCSNTDQAIEICDLTLSAPVGEGLVQHGVHYVFASGNARRDEIRVVADPARPGWMTTDMALDRFWNRVASFMVATGTLAALIASGLWSSLRIVRRRRRWMRADALPVSLRLVSRQRVHNGQVWVVAGEDGQTERWPVSGRIEPFSLGTGDRILGLQRMDGTAIMPLDAKLRWVHLSRAERAAVLAHAGQA